MHLLGGEGLSADETSFPPSPSSPSTYKIVPVCFDEEGNEIAPAGVVPVYDTGSVFPTFAIIKPAIANTHVDMSPYGQCVFADAVDAIQAVGLTFDALVNEVDVSKMRVFLSDVMFDKEQDAKGRRISIPFGKGDCTVFRKVMSTEDVIQEFAPTVRTEAFRISLQMLGDLTGFGISYFDYDSFGYVKTAIEVASDNSALLRNIHRHENGLESGLVGVSRAVMAVSRGLGEHVPDEGDMHVIFDDSIVQDVAAEKDQDMREVSVTMHSWEYRVKWYGEDEKTAKARSRDLKSKGASATVGNSSESV